MNIETIVPPPPPATTTTTATTLVPSSPQPLTTSSSSSLFINSQNENNTTMADNFHHNNEIDNENRENNNKNQIHQHHNNFHHLSNLQQPPPSALPPIVSSPSIINNNCEVPSNNEQLVNVGDNQTTIKRKLKENVTDENKKPKFTQDYVGTMGSLQPNLEYTAFNHHHQQQHPQYHHFQNYPPVPPTLSMMENIGPYSNNLYMGNHHQQQQQQLQPQHQQPQQQIPPPQQQLSQQPPILPPVPLLPHPPPPLPLTTPSQDQIDNSSKIFSTENFLKSDEKSSEPPVVQEEQQKPSTGSNSSSTTLSTNEEALKIHEKLREMGEISVKPVNKSSLSSDTSSTLGKRKESENGGISVEIKKKSSSSSDKYETEESKRITNLRKNIREVMDENQLDATTLAAQRQESERLARVQEQQKLIRELQRQMAAERQNNRTQSRVLSLLQGQNSLLKTNRTNERSISLPSSSADMYVVKGIASEVTFKGSGGFVDIDKISSGNLTPSVSIAPVRRNKVATATVAAPEEEVEDEDSKKEVVTIVDSSSEDDCIVLSDDDEDVEEEPEDDPHNSGLHVNDAFNVPDEKGRVVVNIGHPEGEPDIFIAPQIARVIKPHQIGGVRFLFDNIIESTERFSTSTGFGCILAHSMGLGKTLQVACFCDIFLRHTNSKSVLCIMPINTLQNWVAEFNMWLPEEPDKCPLKSHGEVRPRNFKIFILNDQQKTLSARSKVILEWARQGGVLLIGYELFRLLSLKLSNKKKKRKSQPEKEEKVETPAHREIMENIYAALVRPGPDLVICDEGHRIKNSHASISVALKQIRSKRRIVLTGYPLQNNLLEYWCMVDFVRPNYLGTKTEFANMFERPIQNGQCIDSTPQDIKLMRYRAHVLHSLLVGFVQRRSHAVLQNTLPQKEEYVILVRMTSFQRKLYNVFMNEVVRTKAVPNPLKAFAVCCKIWNHPDVLYNFLKKREADLDLELEEVENEAARKNNTGAVGIGGQTTINSTAIIPAGRRRRAPKKSKEIIKNGKNIPAVEVAPQNMPMVGNLQQQQPQQQQQQQQHLQQQPQLQQQQIIIKEEKPDLSSLKIEEMSTSSSSSTSSSLLQQEKKFDPSLQQQSLQGQQQQLQQQNETNRLNNFQFQSANNTTSIPLLPPPPPPQPYGIPYAGYNSYGCDGGFYSQYDNFYQQDQYSGPTSDYNAMAYNSQPAQNTYWDGNSSFFGGYNPVGLVETSMNSYNHTDSTFGNGSGPPLSHPSSKSSSLSSEKPPPAINNCTNGNGNGNGNGGSNSSSSNNFENSSSSEIVDLDTKEITTVETTINSLEMLKDFKEMNISSSSSSDATKDDVKVKKEEGEEEEDDDDDDVDDEKKIKTESQSLKDEDASVVIEKDIKPVVTKEDGIPYDWAIELMKGYVPDLLENSPKMVIFFRLLEESLNLGDRILVFSQSLLTLNLIERFLQMTKLPGLDYNWVKNKTYFRLDGSTTAMEREKLINEFNANPDIHLFLVSTRAGSLGINLVGANRVIVFDASWNPCHDTQAVCRVYRYGQKKPCFVYRIVMDNCLEKKIYDRQVNKQGMSDRVVDECNPDAHLSIKEVTNLCYDMEDDTEWKEIDGDCKDKYLDIVMKNIIEMHRNLLSKEPFQHESLLIDRKEKKLSSAEKRLAQRGYEMEKRAATKPSSFVYHSANPQYRVMRTADGSIVHRPVASVRPMQAEMSDKVHNIPRPGGVRPTRWIPAEVWQRQGMTAQEMTLPLDVVIPTSSGDKSNIVLKAGQKVMVLKSPKGIYMQLESGKIIAIRTSFKVNQNSRGGNGGGAGDKIGDDCEINTPGVEDQIKKTATKFDGSQEISHHQQQQQQQQSTKVTTMMTTTTPSTTTVTAVGAITNQQSATESAAATVAAAAITPAATVMGKKDQNLKSGYNFAAAKPIYTGGNATITDNTKQQQQQQHKSIEMNSHQATSFKNQQQPTIYSPARQLSGQTSSGSKNFNVQHLIDTKKSTTTTPPQTSMNFGHHHYPKISPSNVNANVKSNNNNNNGEDIVMVDHDSAEFGLQGQHSQTRKPIMSQPHHNQSTKFPAYSERGTKYGTANVNARTHHHHSPHVNMNVNMANVRPQHFRPMDNKNAFQTITIDDDFEPPLREKIVYKPNLTERKSKPMASILKNNPQRMHQHQQQQQLQPHPQPHLQPQPQLQSKQLQQQSLLSTTKHTAAAIAPASVVPASGIGGGVPTVTPTATSTVNKSFYPETNQPFMAAGLSIGSPDGKQSTNKQLQSSKMLPPLPPPSPSHASQKPQYIEPRQKQSQSLTPQPQLQQPQSPHQNVQNSMQKSNEMTVSASKSSNSNKSGKMPTIKNIPAPYPSIFAPHGQNSSGFQTQQLQQPQQQSQPQIQNPQCNTVQQPTGMSVSGSSSNSVSHSQHKTQEKVQNPPANPPALQQNTALTKSSSGTENSMTSISGSSSSSSTATVAAAAATAAATAAENQQVSSVPISQSQSLPLPQSHSHSSSSQAQNQPQSQPEMQYSHYSIADLSSTPQQQFSAPPVPTSHLENNFYSHHDSVYQHHYPNLYTTSAITNPSPYNYTPHAPHSPYSPYASYHHSPYDLNSYSSPATSAVPSTYSTSLPPVHPSHHPPPPPSAPIPPLVPPTSDVGQYHHPHQYSMYPPPPPPPTVTSVAAAHHQPPPPPPPSASSISEQYNSFYPYSYPPTGGQWRPQ